MWHGHAPLLLNSETPTLDLAFSPCHSTLGRLQSLCLNPEQVLGCSFYSPVSHFKADFCVLKEQTHRDGAIECKIPTEF